MRTQSAMIPRVLGLVSQFVTLAGFVVIVAGLAKIQKKTNAIPGMNPSDELIGNYTSTYTQALVQPYPSNPGFQYSFIWFIIFFQLTVFLASLAIILVPGLLHTARAAVLTLLAIVCTLTINVVNNLVFFHKSAIAVTVFGARDINVTLAGALLVVLGNGLTILALGIGAPTVATTTSHPHVVKNGADATAV